MSNEVDRFPVLKVPRGEGLPLFLAQQRLWFLAQMEDISNAYHNPISLRLNGDLNSTALRKALNRILVRHEALRTTFALVDGEPVQRICGFEDIRFLLLEHDLLQREDARAEFERLMKLEAVAPFDLEHGPLIRGRLIRLAEDDHALLITAHHIISDGWSFAVLLNELSALYRAFLRDEA